MTLLKSVILESVKIESVRVDRHPHHCFTNMNDFQNTKIVLREEIESIYLLISFFWQS